MWLRRSKSPRWAMPSSSPNSPGGEEREGVFDVGRAARVVAQLVLVVLAQLQPFAGQAQVGVPLHAAVAPVLVPLAATLSGWQKNSISICSNSRERNVKFRGVISLRKLLPIWAMPNGTLTRVLSSTFLKLTKMPWAVSGRRKAASSSLPSAPTMVLNIRLNSRGSVSVPELLGIGTEDER